MTVALTPESAARIRAKASRVLASGANLEDLRLAFLEDRKQLQRHRKAAGLTAQALADLVGCTVDIVRNIESGRTKLCDPIAGDLWKAVFQACDAKQVRLIAVARLAKLPKSDDALLLKNLDLEHQVSDLQKQLAEVRTQLAQVALSARDSAQKSQETAEKVDRIVARQGGTILSENGVRDEPDPD